MGYRSNGNIWIPKKTYEKLSEELKQDLKEEWQVVQKDIWSFTDWKWYEFSYPTIKAWVDFMAMCDNEELEYEFVRVGEDYGDIEIVGSKPYSVFGVSRSIDIYMEEEEE